MRHLLLKPLLLVVVLLPSLVSAADEHAGHGLPTPATLDDSHDHHADPLPEKAPSAGHVHPTPVAPAAMTPTPIDAPRFPRPTPEEIAAAFPVLAPHAHMANDSWPLLLVDRFEAQDGNDGKSLAWDGFLSRGNALDRAVLCSEGEKVEGESAARHHELYWQHAVARWWESRLGLRRDDGEGPARNWLAVGVQGLAPQFVELSVVAYLGESGRSALTLSAEYDARLTNRLILQPRLELNAYGEDDLENGIGRGLADSEIGLRLRYEVRREIAPYIGVEWSRRHGDSADLARAVGGETGEAKAVAGLRLWF